MSAHDHSEFVEGCYRCDLSRDEMSPPHTCDALDPDWSLCEDCGARHSFCSVCGDIRDSCERQPHDLTAMRLRLPRVPIAAGRLAEIAPDPPARGSAAIGTARRRKCCNSHHWMGCADGAPGCCPRCPINPTSESPCPKCSRITCGCRPGTLRRVGP